MELFFEIHSGLPQEGPGSPESTRKAFEMAGELPGQPEILDIGCGPGRQTLDLLNLSGGRVTAVDNHQPFLDNISRAAKKAGLSDRLTVLKADMNDMPLPENSFDLIWSEGAIYIEGFEAGLKNWRRFLKENGRIAVTEITLLKDNLPEELSRFWLDAYPEIKTLKENRNIVGSSGYTLLEDFVLPGKDWENYYGPLENKINELRAKYPPGHEIHDYLDEESAEIELYRKYGDYYGYVFYIMKA